MGNEAAVFALIAVTAVYDWKLGHKWSSGFKAGLAFAGAVYLVTKYGGT